MDDLRTQITDLLARRKLTHSDLARESGVAQAVISRWLRGQRDVTVGTAERIAEALDKRVGLTRQK